MNQSVLNEIKGKIEQADLVLIGIGEQVAVPTRKMEDDAKYSEKLEQSKEDLIYPYLQQIFIKENCQPYVDFYNRLMKTKKIDSLIAEKGYSQ